MFSYITGSVSAALIATLMGHSPDFSGCFERESLFSPGKMTGITDKFMSRRLYWSLPAHATGTKYVRVKVADTTYLLDARVSEYHLEGWRIIGSNWKYKITPHVDLGLSK